MGQVSAGATAYATFKQNFIKFYKIDPKGKIFISYKLNFFSVFLLPVKVDSACFGKEYLSSGKPFFCGAGALGTENHSVLALVLLENWQALGRSLSRSY